MELLRAHKQTEVWFHELSAPYDFSPPPAGEFALMLWSNVATIEQRQRYDLCLQIIEASCFYAVCGGDSCELWHDTIDDQCIDRFDFSPPDSAFIMTTWHTNESPAEVLWYLLYCTNYPDDLRGPAPAVQRFLILFLGPNEATKQEVLAALNKEFDERIASKNLFDDKGPILFNR